VNKNAADESKPELPVWLKHGPAEQNDHYANRCNEYRHPINMGIENYSGYKGDQNPEKWFGAPKTHKSVTNDKIPSGLLRNYRFKLRERDENPQEKGA
jgi:hypothetical protein